MGDGYLKAIFEYLKSIKPIRNVELQIPFPAHLSLCVNKNLGLET
jgi:hypothetical protein